jgi:hypothetical protein
LVPKIIILKKLAAIENIFGSQGKLKARKMPFRYRF